MRQHRLQRADDLLEPSLEQIAPEAMEPFSEQAVALQVGDGEPDLAARRVGEIREVQDEESAALIVRQAPPGRGPWGGRPEDLFEDAARPLNRGPQARVGLDLRAEIGPHLSPSG